MRQNGPPDTAESRCILAHLEMVLGSPVFARSYRSGELLRHLVERAAQGQADRINEFRIGLSIFDRRLDFNPAEDPAVREGYQRLRGKLAEYYRTTATVPAVRIELPEHGLVPQFHFQQPAAVPFALRLRWPVLVTAMFVLSIAAGCLLSLDHPLRRSHQDATAGELYRRARAAAGHRTRQDLTQAVALYQEAIDRDPRFARAWSGLAQSYVILASNRQGAYSKNMDLARRAASKALQLDPNLAEAQILLASVSFERDHDWGALERSYRTALALEPGNVTGHLWFGINLMAVGNFDEAEMELRRAMQLDPAALNIRTDLVMLYYFSRRYQLAREQADVLSATHPDVPLVLSVQAQAAEALGEYRAAREILGRIHSDDYRATVLATLGRISAREGDRAGAERSLVELARLSDTRLVSPYYFALVQSALGNKDEALAQIEESVRLRDAPVAFLKVDPRWDSLRHEKRFAAALRRLGLWDAPVISLNRNPPGFPLR